jgi:environmental stress-induced protein Ves
MKKSYLPPCTFHTNAWANGTTTELLKYPPESDFLKRDFTFRISTATVEAEESTFSDFSGLTRILMVLEGSITLIHEGRYKKLLAPYEQDTFDGAWSTRSIGKVRDFNVMCNDQATASLRAYTLEKGSSKELSTSSSRVVLFVHAGQFQCANQLLETGSILDLQEVSVASLTLTCLEAGTILFTEVELGLKMVLKTKSKT